MTEERASRKLSGAVTPTGGLTLVGRSTIRGVAASQGDSLRRWLHKAKNPRMPFQLTLTESPQVFKHMRLGFDLAGHEPSNDVTYDRVHRCLDPSLYPGLPSSDSSVGHRLC